MVGALHDLLLDWGSFYSNHAVVRTAVSFVHVAALVAAGGAAITADRGILSALRLDDAARRVQLSAIQKTHRVVAIGLALITVSGLLLLAADLDTYLYSRVFWAKMGAIGLLLINGVVLIAAERRAAARRSGRLVDAPVHGARQPDALVPRRRLAVSRFPTLDELKTMDDCEGCGRRRHRPRIAPGVSEMRRAGDQRRGPRARRDERSGAAGGVRREQCGLRLRAPVPDPRGRRRHHRPQEPGHHRALPADRCYAFNLACPHENTALKWLPKDGRFQCPKHESQYQPCGSLHRRARDAQHGSPRRSRRGQHAGRGPEQVLPVGQEPGGMGGGDGRPLVRPAGYSQRIRTCASPSTSTVSSPMSLIIASRSV